MVGVEEAKRAAVCRVLSKCARIAGGDTTRKWALKTPKTGTGGADSSRLVDWSAVRKNLINKVGLTQQQADSLRTFASLPANIYDALNEIETVRVASKITHSPLLTNTFTLPRRR